MKLNKLTEISVLIIFKKTWILVKIIALILRLLFVASNMQYAINGFHFLVRKNKLNVRYKTLEEWNYLKYVKYILLLFFHWSSHKTFLFLHSVPVKRVNILSYPRSDIFGKNVPSQQCSWHCAEIKSFKKMSHPRCFSCVVKTFYILFNVHILMYNFMYIHYDKHSCKCIFPEAK